MQQGQQALGAPPALPAPKEFKEFIGPNMRLTPVTCADDTEPDKTIKFYMGSNTPERREYIMENLICDSSDF